MALRPSQIRAAAEESALMIPAARRLSQRLAEIDAPVVIIAGGGDRIVSTARQSEALHRDIPGSRLRRLADVGHMVHHIAPGVVLAAIDEAAAMSARRGGERDPTAAADADPARREASVSSATHAAQ
jgi:pimeloyl-ACP methyl ester carboxylesterase